MWEYLCIGMVIYYLAQYNMKIYLQFDDDRNGSGDDGHDERVHMNDNEAHTNTQSNRYKFAYFVVLGWCEMSIN